MAWVTIANVKGPKGDKGDKGDQGDSFYKGKAGPGTDFTTLYKLPEGWVTVETPEDAESLNLPERVGGSILRINYDISTSQAWFYTNHEDGFHLYTAMRTGGTWRSWNRTDGRLTERPELEDLLAWTDKAGQYTDLHLGPDGYFAAPVIQRLQDKLVGGMAMVQAPEPGVSFAVVDKVGQYTDLHLDDSGQFADEVLERMGTRLGNMGLGGGTNVHEVMYVGGKLLPVFPDSTNVTAWGSSSMQGLAPYLASSFPSATLHNEGKGGEWSQQIAARMGAIPALLTVSGGSIPASGPVQVTASNVPALSLMKDFTGTLHGVHGTLSSDGATQTFTRTNVGSVTPVPAGTPFISEVGNASRQHTTFLWPGKNNLKTAGAAALVIEQTETMFAWLTPLVKRCAVLTHFVDSDQAVGSTQHSQVAQVNADYITRYGPLCIDVNAYILSPQIWVDARVAPTAEDLQMQADGVKATSLSADNLHLNDAAEAAVAGFIRKHLQNLQWV